jgi:hypothetical protein
MPKYDVILPLTASVIIRVDAENEKQAIENALEGNLNIEVSGDFDLYECELHKHITQGNVFYGVCNEAYVEEVE